MSFIVCCVVWLVLWDTTNVQLFQYSCVEGKDIDLRQSLAVLRKRPRVIFFEAPMQKDGTIASSLNRYPPNRKPLHELRNLEAR